MNREQAKKIWPIIKAFGEGKQIAIDKIHKRNTDNLNFSLYPECYSILPDRKIVDLSKVVGSTIPMLFSDTENSVHKYRLQLGSIFPDSSYPFRTTDFWFKHCEFDTSENNWVSWGPHVPEYDGKFPLPDGVKFEVAYKSGLVAVAAPHIRWTWADRDGDVIAYRVVGLLPDYCYAHDAEVTE